MRSPIPLTILTLTYNEEQNLPACLASVQGLSCETIVIDSGSTDHTREIAARFGARVYAHPFESHAQQWHWALNHLPLDSEWILGLDADQRLTPALCQELADLFTVHSKRLNAVDGFYIKRRQIFRGRWIKHGGYYPKYLLKLFRRRAVKLDKNDLVDHHFWVDGPTAKLEHDLIEDNQRERDIAFWIEKHNRYARLLAREELARRNGLAWPVRPRLIGSPDQRVAWIKQRWYTLPLYVRPFLYFLYRYFFLLGFLDGKEGFVFHFLHAFWYRLLVDIHLDDLLAHAPPSDAGSQIETL